MDFMLLKCISVKLLQVKKGEVTAGNSGNRKNVSPNLMINSAYTEQFIQERISVAVEEL